MWTGCVMGGFIYRGTTYPSAWEGRYIYGDYQQGWIRYVTFDSSSNQVIDSGDFEINHDSIAGIVSLVQGPDGNLWFAIYKSDGTGSIRRVLYTSNGGSPSVITAPRASPSVGTSIPMYVEFHAAVSDSDNTKSSYTWSFGDGTTFTGTLEKGNGDAYTTHIYKAYGVYNAQLSVQDSSFVTTSDTVR